MTKFEILEFLPSLRMAELAEIIKKAQTLRRADKFKKNMILRGKRDQFWEEICRNLGIQFAWTFRNATSSSSHNRWSFSWRNERFYINLGEDSLNIALYGSNLKKRVKRNKLGSVSLEEILNTMINMNNANKVLQS